jgi:hypothetical protein
MNNWGLIVKSIATVALWFGSGCASEHSDRNPRESVDQTEVIQSALQYFHPLLQDGKLPGSSKGEHGESGAHMPYGWKGVVYPQIVAIWVEKTSESEWVYWYYLQRDSVYSSWRLTEAWRGTKQGHDWQKLFPAPDRK